MVPRSWTAIPVISDSFEEASGVFKETDKLSAEGLVFATDATGGPSQDPRLRLVAWAIVACELIDGVVSVVGCVTGLLPGHQSVFRGEAFAAARLCELTTAEVNLTLDCLGVKKRLLSRGPGNRVRPIMMCWSPCTCRPASTGLRLFGSGLMCPRSSSVLNSGGSTCGAGKQTVWQTKLANDGPAVTSRARGRFAIPKWMR